MTEREIENDRERDSKKEEMGERKKEGEVMIQRDRDMIGRERMK